MKRTRIFGSLLAVSLLLGGLIWVAAAQAVGSVNEKNKHPESDWRRLNRLALNIKSGDRAAIQPLVDEVFLAHGLDHTISAGAPSIKDRLVAAEVDFHNGTGDGIDAEKVAVSVNQLVERLKLPAYASTDAAEVKKVRVRMLTLYPDLVGRGSAARRDDSQPHFEDKMSPVEAFHVAATLMEQKVFNPEFQLTSQERRENLRQAGTARQAGSKGSALPQASSERTHEMVAAIRQGAAAMSFRDMLEQSEQSLDLLGIGR